MADCSPHGGGNGASGPRAHPPKPSDVPQRAAPLQWEQDPRIDDGHRHDWIMVIIAPRGGSDPKREAMTICRTCRAPRCGDTFDTDPCLSRRHHADPHIHESGQVRALGG